jgi:hypothetical protein
VTGEVRLFEGKARRGDGRGGSNPVPGAFYREAAQITGEGFAVTRTNAYSGNNGRAAVTADAGGKELIYTSGNAGNGGNPRPADAARSGARTTGRGRRGRPRCGGRRR